MAFNVVLGVTGGIAAYKSCEIVSRLKKQGVSVDVIMTKHAEEFVGEITFRSLSGNKVTTDMFDTNIYWEIEHISLAKKADLFLIAPATANIIGKIANGIADDMLSTTVMATKAPVLIAPAMNTNMYCNIAVQENIKKLQERGITFINPVEGLLACNDIGAGKMEEPEKIVEQVMFQLNKSQELKGKKVLVTAGPTIEAIDPVRYVTNRSTGKMGYAIAYEAALRGAEVTLITGKTDLAIPFGINKVIKVISAEDMYQEVIKHSRDMDIIIKSAAVADYTPKTISNSKIKKKDGDLSIELKRTKDILSEVGKSKKSGQIVVGFAAETDDVMKNAQDKMDRKNLDLIVANDINREGAGFGVETNIVNIIKKNGEIISLPQLEKAQVAKELLNIINQL